MTDVERTVPGPNGRLIKVTWIDNLSGWALNWKDTGELIQHRVYGTLELLDCLGSTLPPEEEE